MAFRPLHDRVLVRRVEAEAKTAGGIIIPDTAQEKPQEGEVVSVGSGTRADDGTVTALDVKAGDKILFGKWSGTEVKIDGEDLLIMKESDILGIVSEAHQWCVILNLFRDNAPPPVILKQVQDDDRFQI